MRKVALPLLVLGVSLLSSVLLAQTSQPTIPVSDIHPGMRGVAYTVFQGVKPEPMDVEVLGVLHGMNGPKSNIILVRLHGQKVEYTGVVAGMSGSPVYIDGRLVGAIRIGPPKGRKKLIEIMRSRQKIERPKQELLDPANLKDS